MEHFQTLLLDYGEIMYLKLGGKTYTAFTCSIVLSTLAYTLQTNVSSAKILMAMLSFITMCAAMLYIAKEYEGKERTKKFKKLLMLLLTFHFLAYGLNLAIGGVFTMIIMILGYTRAVSISQ